MTETIKLVPDENGELDEEMGNATVALSKRLVELCFDKMMNCLGEPQFQNRGLSNAVVSQAVLNLCMNFLGNVEDSFAPAKGLVQEFIDIFPELSAAFVASRAASAAANAEDADTVAAEALRNMKPENEEPI